MGLWYLEFFENDQPYRASSFLTYQQHLESTFGKPTEALPSEESYIWKLDGFLVIHRITERFGPSEIVYIQRDSASLAEGG